MAAGGGLTFLGVFRGGGPHKSNPPALVCGKWDGCQPLGPQECPSERRARRTSPVDEIKESGAATFPTCTPVLEASEK